MTPTTDTQTPAEALVDRLFQSTIAGLELLSVHLGWSLGLYRTLAERGPLTPPGLAQAAGIDARYAREWLEQQAVAGLLAVEDAAAPADERRYLLPEGHAEVLADPESPSFVAPFAPMLVGIAGALPEVVEAYARGGGVPYERYGPDFRAGQAAINRPAFTHEMTDWLGSIPAVDERLNEAGARVADVGCGLGASTVAIARAYPRAAVVGVDSDPASIDEARAAAAPDLPDGRVEFRCTDAAALGGEDYDLVTIFEALHDMARPVAALEAARAALAPGGRVLVVDERVAERFTAPGDEVERMMYGWSVSHCLPTSRAEEPSAALGTALRADTVRELAAEAGFVRTEVLPIENDFFRFYLLEP